ncbi:DUF4267 domain-containing protein [Streptomyces sp. Z26]|uniref:DUF4267 domain-containing protein n=1 Tax=Streptomyces TaxID=1883 RepID=UPI0019CF9D61|nr:DUF4267 domain-containing protein [Streptomyces sp. Z26]
MGAGPVRVVGAATAAYGVGVLVRPELMARPCGLTDEDGSVPAATALLIRALGARDAAVGVAMVAAGDGSARRTATACRVVSDVADAVLLGTLLPDPAARRKAAVVAGVWGALCAAAGLAADS